MLVLGAGWRGVEETEDEFHVKTNNNPGDQLRNWQEVSSFWMALTGRVNIGFM